MQLVLQLTKSILAWLIGSIIIIFIIFIPRDVTYETSRGNAFEAAHYEYSWEKHKESFTDYLAFLRENKSLGDYAPNYSIEELLQRTVLKSLILVIPALIIGFVLGLLKGLTDYRFSKNKYWAYPSNSTSWLLLSIPDFFIVLVIQIVLMYLYEIGILPHITLFGSDKVENVFLGIIYLAIYPVFFIAKVTSASLEEEQRKDYIRTARSKGTNFPRILYLHILPNSIIKVLQQLSTITLFVLSNLFIIEKFTEYRGAGYYFMDSVYAGSVFKVGQNHDLSNPSISIAYTLIFTFVVLVFHMIGQILIYRSSPYQKTQ